VFLSLIYFLDVEENGHFWNGLRCVVVWLNNNSFSEKKMCEKSSVKDVCRCWSRRA